MNYFYRFSPLMDKYAVSASVLCTVHCLFLPLMVGFFPALGASIFGQEAFHQMLLWIVIPLSLFSLTLGCKQHKSWFVALCGLFGLIVLSVAAFAGHDVLGETTERIVTIVGASAIAVAHLRNYSLCRKKPHAC